MNFLSHFQSVIKRNINTKYEARIFSHLRCPTSFGISKPSDTNLYAVKYFNNTFRHFGQMAQWSGLLTYDTDPY